MSILDESYIEKKVTEWAVAHNCLHRKVDTKGSQGEVGWPDHLYILPHGTHVWIEFKRPGHFPKPIQHYRISELQKRKVHVYVCSSYYEAVGILDSALLSENRNAAYDQSSLRRFAAGSGLR